jgi:hypothetical protein
MFLFESDLNCFDANCGMTSQLLVNRMPESYGKNESNDYYK